MRVTYSIAGQTVATRVTGDPDPANNGLFYMYSDHLGSANTAADTSNNIVNDVRFYPFGSLRSGSINDNITDRGFTGHHENREIGLTYMNARYYLPGVGRFVTADTIVPDPVRPQSFNRYSYVLNSPLNFNDPTGHHLCDPELPASCDPDHHLYNGGLDSLFDPPNDDLLIRAVCISLGPACDPAIKYKHFGIPTTQAQKDAMIAKRSRELCYAGDGACTTKEVGIVFSMFMIPFSAPIAAIEPLAGIALGSMPTAFEVIDAGIRGNYFDAGTNVAYEVGGEIGDEFLKEGFDTLPIAGPIVGLWDVGQDVSNLSSTELGYWDRASLAVDGEILQANQAFMDAYISITFNMRSNPASSSCLCSSIPIPYSLSSQPFVGPTR